MSVRRKLPLFYVYFLLFTCLTAPTPYGIILKFYANIKLAFL
jgi:hypothetical protein